MSRIEEALKKVSRHRNNATQAIGPSQSRSDVRLPGDYLKPGKADMTKLLDVAEPISVDNVLLVTTSEENSKVSEEYNKLRSSVIALTRGESFLNTLMVTSTVSDEGKSMTVLNLAISLAREYDHTVLLVDSDLRRPSIHKYLGIEPEYGLTHCLRDGVPIDQALIKTGLGKLVVLPAGEPVEDPVDLLSSNRMKEIIKELKHRYSERYVIFDTPPAFPFADAGILASYVDGVLFVVREGQATRPELEKTILDLKEHNFLGVIYNDAHTFFKKQDYYYY